MSDRASHWQTVYSTKAENEVSWFQADPATSLRMIADAKAAADSSIIDIGGGASRLVDALLARGFRALTVLDISAAALETAQKRLGAVGENVEWIAADVTQWRPARTYGLWHDRAAFHFLTEASDRAAYVDRLHTAVSPGGQVIIATFAPDGPEKCSGLPVQRYDSDQLAQTLGPAFELVDHLIETHRTPWSTTQSFQFSRFRRVSS
jgi:trans-aconitate methyltransferase